MSKRPISYTSRDFESIKSSLVDYAKRYYSESYKDFNEASFGSLMLDSAAYIGDILSFYLDYQTNESFIDSAIEKSNIERVGKQMGYKSTGSSSSTGVIAFFAVIPATNGVPNANYLPTLMKNSLVASKSGANYLLVENLDFADQNNEVVVAKVDDTTGQPTHFAVKAYGKVISGELRAETFSIGSFQRFRKLDLETANISEIVKVTDSDGREFIEVPYLSQNTVYMQISNQSETRDATPYILKARPAPRRFIVDYTNGETSLQFGFGTEENTTTNVIADPSEVILNMHGRDFVTDDSFDPSKMLETDKFGIAPSNTTLVVTSRSNTIDNVNAAVGSIRLPISIDVTFKDDTVLDSSQRQSVISSIECYNEEPILGDVADPTIEEMRLRAYDSFATQNRAVTKQDYAAVAYRMPSKFGAIKRINIAQDRDAFKRNLNLFVLSEDKDGNFIQANQTIKNNLKTWLINYKMLNDTIDILNGQIVNLQIDYEVESDFDVNKHDLLARCNEIIERKFASKMNLGERFYISDIYLALNSVPGVIDTTGVSVLPKRSPGYSQYPFAIYEHLSNDGRSILAPEDVAFEIKNFEADISGVIN